MLFSHLFVRVRSHVSVSLLFPFTILHAFYLYPDVRNIPFIFFFFFDSATPIISDEYG
jgi:hypothetical protein